jgi:hypothetical protein
MNRKTFIFFLCALLFLVPTLMKEKPQVIPEQEAPVALVPDKAPEKPAVKASVPEKAADKPAVKAPEPATPAFKVDAPVVTEKKPETLPAKESEKPISTIPKAAAQQ